MRRDPCIGVPSVTWRVLCATHDAESLINGRCGCSRVTDSVDGQFGRARSVVLQRLKKALGVADTWDVVEQNVRRLPAGDEVAQSAKFLRGVHVARAARAV